MVRDVEPRSLRIFSLTNAGLSERNISCSENERPERHNSSLERSAFPGFIIFCFSPPSLAFGEYMLVCVGGLGFQIGLGQKLQSPLLDFLAVQLASSWTGLSVMYFVVTAIPISVDIHTLCMCHTYRASIPPLTCLTRHTYLP